MKKLILVIFALLVGALLFAQSYTVIHIYGANGSRGKAHLNSLGPVTEGQDLVDTDYVELKKGNWIMLDNGLAIYKSGRVKEVVEKRKSEKSLASKIDELVKE